MALYHSGLRHSSSFNVFAGHSPDLGGDWEDAPDVGLMWFDNRMMSCCNKAGRETWNGRSAQWECSSCGAAKSNDPNFLFKSYTPGGARANDPVTIKPEVKSGPQCECGSEKVGSDKHSHYCPKA